MDLLHARSRREISNVQRVQKVSEARQQGEHNQGKNWRGGWTPPGKQITPTANAREKSWGGRVSNFRPPLGLIPGMHS